MQWQELADRLFSAGHDIAQQGDFLHGTGRRPGREYAVIGTANHAEVGVELALAMAGAVLRTIEAFPGRPILFLVDTQGQRLRHRDELLGLNRYMSHLCKCVEAARRQGHRVLGLVYSQALSGGFLPNGMAADLCAALPQAEIRVMNLPAMARVTRLDEGRLRELSGSSPVFAPGAQNYVSMGAIDGLWEGDLGQALDDAWARATPQDGRAALGQARGGRRLAHEIIAGIRDRA
ncbi:biotin-independent malonate decarboxylase subunit gamma [Orrella sp. JC864]|uniref:biotin-independent malonate decarboxylase subunit gamma n=1 Tax=Orrella sp. JC864 TaxID=3120298 RepID=UPI00300AA11D